VCLYPNDFFEYLFFFHLLLGLFVATQCFLDISYGFVSPIFSVKNYLLLAHGHFVSTLLLEKWEYDTHTPEMGTWESTRTPKTSELDYRGQNTSH
jgi:hypothetical protein